MAARRPKFTIILAGGKGTRMRSADRHKVCFPIDGRPAINRAIDVYKSCGIRHHIVVVGAMAGQVVETVGQEHAGIIFAYQAEQLGTAHATRQGERVLQSLSEDEDVLIVTGDRVVEPSVLEQLFDLFYDEACDMAFVVGPKQRRSDPGHVLLADDGSVLGNVEVRDILQRQVYRELRASAEEDTLPTHKAIQARIRQDLSPEKAAIAFGALWHAVAVEERDPSPAEILKWARRERTHFRYLSQTGEPVTLTPMEVRQTLYANYSIYLLRAPVLRYALTHLDRDNAQQEEYLSDVITIVAQARDAEHPRYRIRPLKVTNPNHVMAFNDPAELLEIEAYIQSKKPKRMTPALKLGGGFRPIDEWQRAFARLAKAPETSSLAEELRALYGDGSLIAERRSAYEHLLARAAQVLGPEEPVLLVRSPGRVNVMGRHIDHQGGNCNLMTIGYEVLLAVHPRQDDHVCLWNVDAEQFPARDFSISDLVADLPWTDWMSLVNSEKVSRMVRTAEGDWAQYVKAATLRLQKKFSTLKLRGADIVVNGNVPIAAGLSSSSALVVATAEAMVAINQLDTLPSQFVDLCGEGEWFVGTRGGSADHAAIKLGQKGKVVKVTFFDFAVQDVVSFPKDHIMVVCDSQIKAQKTANARERFNHRIACYHIGFALIRRLFPQYAPLLHHLRDVNTRTLGLPLSWIYKILLRLPEQATRLDLERMLSSEEIHSLLTHQDASMEQRYPIRGVALFGLAEFERARQYADALRSGDLALIGKMMAVSHNGDRVTQLDADGTRSPYQAPTSNGYLLDLIEDLESGEPERVIQAQLEWQPGGYRCSLPEIDHMVDVASRVEGVLGAQLAGAGLGGCMMVLTHQDALPTLTSALVNQYYRPQNLEPAIMPCQPVAGSTVLLASQIDHTAELGRTPDR